MKRTLSLPTKSFSINAMHCKNRSWTTQAYKDWSATVFHRLSSEENLKALEDLREFFDSEKHSYKVDIKFTYPKNILFTKKGSMSARAHDLSNIEKPLIDLIFLPCYFDKPSPYGCKNLNIDDKFISALSSKKLPGDEHFIEIDLTIIDL